MRSNRDNFVLNNTSIYRVIRQLMMHLSVILDGTIVFQTAFQTLATFTKGVKANVIKLSTKPLIYFALL